jgi:hypothetical protein
MFWIDPRISMLLNTNRLFDNTNDVNNEVFVLLGFYAACVGICLTKFRNSV